MRPAHLVINAASADEAAALLLRCCGSAAWVERMMQRRPFASAADVQAAALEIWDNLSPVDVRAAFDHHPRIGAAVEADRQPMSTADWSAAEQSGLAHADRAILDRLRAANHAYESRFGFVFLVCATGKDGPEMLALLETRLHHDPEEEFRIAAMEQAKITRLRLDNLGR
ncbi:MAG: 2-oxo-4-hydroxy-4-carboxy-5-ureidoimidazoline decarboxylase [Polyangiaceae bacterium]|jgi:2-oxo-4-hydroxy-4-carboxy-5-ureidoimidazoline decarboxylase